MKSTRIVLVAALPAALLTLLAGCTTPAAVPSTAPPPTVASASASAAAAHNEADTTFAQMMVIHHEGAIEMAALAESNATTAEVRSLATRIRDAQGPEIDQMRGWLQAWGEPAPEDADMGGMGHGGMDMGGMDQQQAMAELGKVDGQAFDRKFLELMIQHHEGAITMAEQQVAQGRNDAAVALAKSVISAQQKEITEMKNLLAKLG